MAAKGAQKDLKILMLHGFTQSGPLFHAKTRALEKLLHKSLAPLKLSATLIYPTAPNRLSARDVPGYTEASDAAENDEHAADTSDSWAWWRKDDATGTYRLFEEGMSRVAETIREVYEKGARTDEPGPAGAIVAASAAKPNANAGPIDGVIGFSQGGALAALLAAALEPGREPPSKGEGEYAWLKDLREANGGQPLKFAVTYSGFFAPPAELQWLYEPHIKTPTLHFIGSLDTVVEEGKSRGLVAKCVDPVVAVHPGGHYVPVSKEWAMPLVGFIKKSVDEERQDASDEDN